MQHRITQPSRLLDRDGELKQRGYATSLILRYRREDVAKKLRLKEWDYYLIYNERYGVALTVGKYGVLALITITFLDFYAKRQKTKTVLALVPFDKLTMPESSAFGDIQFSNRRVSVSIRHEFGRRQLSFKMKRFEGFSDIEVSMALSNEPWDSMVIATPFKEDPKAFYYNQKLIGMRASGSIRIKDHTYTFAKQDSFGLLDWGRGVFPHKGIRYRSAAQGLHNNLVFGFNLGYGFGDTSTATENMLFYRGIAHKLRDVEFAIPKDSEGNYEYLKPWKITSSDHRIEMEFTPILDRRVFLTAPIVSKNQYQVFGRFSGTATLDNGSVLKVMDLLGFAERVENRR